MSLRRILPPLSNYYDGDSEDRHMEEDNQEDLDELPYPKDEDDVIYSGQRQLTIEDFDSERASYRGRSSSIHSPRFKDEQIESRFDLDSEERDSSKGDERKPSAQPLYRRIKKYLDLGQIPETDIAAYIKTHGALHENLDKLLQVLRGKEEAKRKRRESGSDCMK